MIEHWREIITLRVEGWRENEIDKNLKTENIQDKKID